MIFETYWTCIDCLEAAAGISDDERGAAYPAETLSLIVNAQSIFPGDDESENFATYGCEGCGTSLAGSRHAVTVVVAP